MRSRYRWAVVLIFFLFMLLHQADKLLIGPLTTSIMEEFGINEEQMGVVFTGAIIVAAIFYPLWGYLFDRFARAKLLALASFIWGSTTWLSAIVPSFPLFVATRASTGIDDSSYPGLYSLVSDYFGPQMRGRVYGLLQTAMPMGYMLGLIMASTLVGVIGWRNIYLATGAVGILIALAILLFVREVPRGQSEPGFEEIAAQQQWRFDLQEARGLLRKRSMLLLFAQGFFGVFPWNVLTYWAFRYLETERGYTSGQATLAMAIAVLTLAVGYFAGGTLGDALFRRTRRGRMLVSLIAVLLGAGFLYLALNVPVGNTTTFIPLLAITAFFMPFAAPNVTATVHDITVPEVRSTALAVQYFIEQGGSALAPLLAGMIAVRSSLQTAILAICIGTWTLCGLILAATTIAVPHDIAALRETLQERVREARAAASN